MFLPMVHQWGVSMGIGAATLALVFIIQATYEENKEGINRLMRGLRVVSYLAILAVLAVLGFSAYAYTAQGLSIATDPIFLIESTLMAILTLHAILTAYNKMPMWLGPSIMAGAWYALFFLQTLPISEESYLRLCAYVVLFISVFYAVYTILQGYLSKNISASETPSLFETPKEETTSL